MVRDEKITIFEKIRLWWRFDGKYCHKNFIEGVKNLWKWFPVIWKDRDWDSFFIYEVIRVKLNNQAEYIGGKNRHTNAKRDAELMRLTSRLIQRCQDDHYNMEYMDYHESNILWLDVTDVDNIPEKYKDSKRLEIEEISENFDEYFKKYPRQYKRVMSGEVNRFSRPVEEKDKNLIAMEIAHENQDRCRKLVFKIMSNRVEGWWD
jgi:hypothetical protein